MTVTYEIYQHPLASDLVTVGFVLRQTSNTNEVTNLYMSVAGKRYGPFSKIEALQADAKYTELVTQDQIPFELNDWARHLSHPVANHDE